MENEVRLIDANAFAEKLKSMHGHGDYEANMYCAEACYGLGNWVWEDPEDYGLEEAEKALKEAPTIDPESLRPKGRWEPIVDSVWNLPMPVLSGWRCSECGRTEQEKEPYCNCGAKMEG